MNHLQLSAAKMKEEVMVDMKRTKILILIYFLRKLWFFDIIYYIVCRYTCPLFVAVLCRKATDPRNSWGPV